jgi:hypothetical protein
MLKNFVQEIFLLNLYRLRVIVREVSHGHSLSIEANTSQRL